MDTPATSNLDPLAAASDADPAPLVPAGAAPTVEEQLALMQKQMAALLALTQGNMQLAAGMMATGAPMKPSDEALAALAAAEPMPAPKPQRRVRVILEDNDNVPPGGQFISVDGMPYLLQANMEASVPVNVLDVLDHAIMSVPVVDMDKNVIGYRDRLRFPYRVVRDRDRERDYEPEDNLTVS